MNRVQLQPNPQAGYQTARSRHIQLVFGCLLLAGSGALIGSALAQRGRGFKAQIISGAVLAFGSGACFCYGWRRPTLGQVPSVSNQPPGGPQIPGEEVVVLVQRAEPQAPGEARPVDASAPVASPMVSQVQIARWAAMYQEIGQIQGSVTIFDETLERELELSADRLACEGMRQVALDHNYLFHGQPRSDQSSEAGVDYPRWVGYDWSCYSQGEALLGYGALLTVYHETLATAFSFAKRDRDYQAVFKAMLNPGHWISIHDRIQVLNRFIREKSKTQFGYGT
jgi:hypothetical protein